MERYQETVVMTVGEQRELLAKPVHPKFIKRDPQVKGSYTTGDYVRTMLNTIFGPDNWSHEILQGPEIVQINESLAYAHAVVRLTVQFANGNQVIHDDVGAWPLSAGSRTLDVTKPERFETVLKAAVIDGLKACSIHLGACFRPMADEQLEAYLRQKQAAQRKVEDRETEDEDAAGDASDPDHSGKTGSVDEAGAPADVAAIPERLERRQTVPVAPARDPAPQPAPVSQAASKLHDPAPDDAYGPTEFWTEAHKLKNAGKIASALDIRNAQAVRDAMIGKATWRQAAAWLHTQQRGL